MSRKDLLNLLSLGEGQNLEFKIGINQAAIGKVVCAFLNSSGGFIVIGVSDRGDVVGVPAGQNIRKLEQSITAELAPKALVSFEEQQLEGKPVWVIEVPAGRDVPYSFKNEIFVREGERTGRADVDTIRDMVMRRQVEPERWERRFSDADPERDLEREEIAATARQAAAAQRGGLLAESPANLLERLGLLKYGRLTNGGDVLFAMNPAVRHPQVRVRAACYTGDKSDETYRDYKNFEGPLVQVLEQTFAFIQRNTPSRSKFRPGQLAREEQGAYPTEAIREGLVNAFAHRDYADFRGGIAVHIYPNRLEIWNSGSFLDGITPESLAKGHLSVLRNPDIAHVLYLRGMMEKLGRGGVLIRKACEVHGLRLPEWKSDPTGITLTFFAAEVTAEVTAVLNALTETMTRQELQEKLGLKHAEHFRKHYLLPALEGGFIAMTIPDKPQSRMQRYKVTELGRRALAQGGESA